MAAQDGEKKILWWIVGVLVTLSLGAGGYAITQHVSFVVTAIERIDGKLDDIEKGMSGHEARISVNAQLGSTVHDRLDRMDDRLSRIDDKVDRLLQRGNP